MGGQRFPIPIEAKPHKHAKHLLFFPSVPCRPSFGFNLSFSESFPRVGPQNRSETERSIGIINKGGPSAASVYDV